MKIKIPDDACQQAVIDLELSASLRKKGQDALQVAQSLFDQAKGVELSVQSRTYRQLGLSPEPGDVMEFSDGNLVRNDPDPSTDSGV